MSDNENDKKAPELDETVLGDTALNFDDSANKTPDISSTEESEDPNKTVLTNYDSQFSQDATVLSGATALDGESREAINFDPDATQAINPDKATVLAGGTEAMNMSQEVEFAPRIGVGSTINNRFTLEKLLGRGGMGEVYLAVDERKVEAQDKNPHVAMKVLGENFKHHPQAFIALQREARKTQELAHPNIVTVYDFDRQGGSVYLTMEALNGKPMDEEIRSDVRPLEQAVKLITDCAKGLAYAHEKNLVHSDLKPGNLFLTEEGNVKLLDFGIARAFKSGQALDQKALQSQDTVFDAADLGALTPAYASLEMLNGEEPHPSDDVYALGLIAYELLTGKHPFDKKNASLAQEEGLTVERVKGLNKQQWKAIEKALAFDRENRISDASEFLALFTAKSKTPLYIAATVILLAFIGVGSINFFIEPALGPEIPFEQLSKQEQQSFQKNMADVELALKFKDYSGALSYLDKAFDIHPYNKQVMEKADMLVKDLITQIKALNISDQRKQIEILLQHTTLKNNEALLEFQQQL